MGQIPGRPRFRIRPVAAAGAGIASLLMALAGSFVGVARAATTATATFIGAGEYPFRVPTGVTSVTVKAVGAKGGNCPIPDYPPGDGGEGAMVVATVAISPSEQLLVGVGGPGADCNGASGNGAGAPGGIGGGGVGGATTEAIGGAGGGGASLVGVASPSPGFAGPLVVAGAGGGGAVFVVGGPSGSPGQTRRGDVPAQPGTLTSGGAGGSGDRAGASGSFGLGGAGGSCAAFGGGGGGGGYYGGGGGGCGINSGASGGGGASFVVPGATSASAVLTDAAPMVSITYAAPTADASPTALRFAAQTPGTAGPAQTVTVSNKGSAPLVVDGVLLGGADPGDFLVFDRCQQEVAVGSSCQIGVRFAPQVAGARAATLTLLTNAASASAVVALAGGGGGAPHGLAGKVELLTCRPIIPTFTATARPHGTPTEEMCHGKLIPGAARFTARGASARAAIERGRTVYATGASVPTADGGSELVLTERRPTTHGPYTLLIRERRGRRWVTRRLRVVVR